MIPDKDKEIRQRPKITHKLRLISLLNTYSKVFERLLLTRLQTLSSFLTHLEPFDFRYHHSPTLQLVYVLDNIISAKSLSNKTAAVLLDVQNQTCHK